MPGSHAYVRMAHVCDMNFNSPTHAHFLTVNVTKANCVNNVKRFKFIRRTQKLAPKEPATTATDDELKKEQKDQNINQKTCVCRGKWQM